MEADYTKRELDDHFRRLGEKIDENTRITKDLGVKVDKTNGSVGNLKAWRTGLGMCVALIAFIVIPLMVYSFQLAQENLRNQILLQVQNK